MTEYLIENKGLSRLVLEKPEGNGVMIDYKKQQNNRKIEWASWSPKAWRSVLNFCSAFILHSSIYLFTKKEPSFYHYYVWSEERGIF